MNWLSPYIEAAFRAPNGGLTGWFARYVMRDINPPSVDAALDRLSSSSLLTDKTTFLELGSGHGASLMYFDRTNDPQHLPARIVCVEISPDFRNDLERLQSTLAFGNWVEIYPNDAKDLPFLEDNLVDCAFGMNVIKKIMVAHCYSKPLT